MIFQKYKNVVLRNIHSFGWLLWLWFYPIVWQTYDMSSWQCHDHNMSKLGSKCSPFLPQSSKNIVKGVTKMKLGHSLIIIIFLYVWKIKRET
jgi:hypothetical protein